MEDFFALLDRRVLNLVVLVGLGALFLVDRVSKLAIFKFGLVVLQKLVVLADFLFDLRQQSHGSHYPVPSRISVLHLILTYFVLFKSVDQFLAYAYDIRRKVCPFHLRLVKSLLCKVLFFL